MNPPWIEFPDIPMGSAGWRMGHGEPYMQRWLAFYQALQARERSDYKISWPAPRSWGGFFAYVDEGTLPPSVTERRARLEEPQLAPSPGERRIVDYYRVQWLIRHHMQQLDSFQVSARYPSPYIGQRVGEHLMGYYEAADGSWWRVSNPDRGGLEMLRVDADLLRNWIERLP